MRRIAIVDDDREIRAVLREILTAEGYDVIEAASGNEAVRLFRNHAIDLMIVDIIMEEMDGLETITALTNEYLGVKIIAISGGGRLNKETYLDFARRLGALRSIAKPLQRSEILGVVKELLEEGKPQV